ncbi:MAG TPA: hypothetical protein VFW40_08350 [Capsulimonadaceae bacterium]|nr:hypothetical protein [Capsulimonadaceae bacterium]
MTAIQSIHLLWQREAEGVLGLPKHAVADNGTVAVAVRDNPQDHAIQIFDYELHRLANGHARPDAEPAGQISIEGIRKLEFAPHGQIATAISDKGLSFIRFEQGEPALFPYMPGRGLIFLDSAIACADPRWTLAFLMQDRASNSFTLTVAEGKEKLTPIWAKSWNAPLSTVAISADGDWLAIGHANGGISLLDRGRRLRWEYISATGRPVLSLAVDSSGSVLVADSIGEIRRHEPTEGAILWRGQLAEMDDDLRAPGTKINYRISTDKDAQIAGVAMAVMAKPMPNGQPEVSRYFVIDGASGDILWEEDLSSRPTGIALSPSGEFMAISTLADLRSFSIRRTETKVYEAPARTTKRDLLQRARKETVEGHYFAALPLLAEVLESDPANVEAALLHEEVSWQVREAVMELTTQSTRESLAMVEAALLLLPHSEKLTVRRNALARILATKHYEEGERLAAVSRFENAIAQYREAIALDAGAIDARRGILKAEERMLKGVLQKVQTAISEAKWDEAQALLAEASALRPDNQEIAAIIAGIQRDQAFAEAMRYYNAQRYPEAAFQFKRTLALDPGHMEALRHLNLVETHLRKKPEQEKEPRAAPSPEPYRIRR